jgi:hypothetical protein
MREMIFLKGCFNKKIICRSNEWSRRGTGRMYIHAFLFRWVEGITEEQKKHVQQEILALQGKIPGLLETHVGTNVSPRGQDYTFGGVMKFVDRAALDAYFPHPVHQALGEWLMPMIEPLELDFDAASSTEKYSG